MNYDKDLVVILAPTLSVCVCAGAKGQELRGASGPSKGSRGEKLCRSSGPDGPFMMQVGRNLTDPFDGFLRGKRFLILDRDKKFTTEFRDLLEHAGTDVIRLPHRSPNLNAYIERFVLSIKSECLERMIFFSEQSLRRAVAEFIHHYHGERNHQGLGNALLEAEECVGSPHGKVRCRKRLGGLLSYYHRAAASRPAGSVE